MRATNLGRTVAGAAVLALLVAACNSADEAPPIDGDVPEAQGADSPSEQDGQNIFPDKVGLPECPPRDAPRDYNPPADEQPEPDPTITSPELFEDIEVGDDEAELEAAPDDGLAPISAADQWARASAPEHFAGVWLDNDHDASVIAFTEDVEQCAAQVRDQFGSGWWVVEAEYSEAELDALSDDVFDAVEATREEAVPGTVGTIASWSSSHDHVAIDVVGGDDEALAQIAEQFDHPAYCFTVLDPPPEVDPDGPVTTLAAVEGWREEAAPVGDSRLEVAYDEATAERLVDDNVPSDLSPAPADEPWEDGVHGELDDVDFDTHVVAVWSSGGSSSCPRWVHDVATFDDGVQVEMSGLSAVVCTADHAPYRSVIAVERERLPTKDELPADLDLGDQTENDAVVAYPED